jgi:hypothetical protein
VDLSVKTAITVLWNVLLMEILERNTKNLWGIRF